MKFSVILPMIGVSVFLSSAPVIAAEDAGARFTATLDGASEVPRLGDPDGMGTATIRVNPGRGQLCYSITVSGIEPAVAAHIHEAPAGTAGPVVFGLTAPTGGTSQGCVAISREFAKEFMKSPGDYYVNVHNAEFPGGAVRGQLGK
jgi:hypothetical protein